MWNAEFDERMRMIGLLLTRLTQIVIFTHCTAEAGAHDGVSVADGAHHPFMDRGGSGSRIGK